jgi:hypothetical protein
LKVHTGWPSKFIQVPKLGSSQPVPSFFSGDIQLPVGVGITWTLFSLVHASLSSQATTWSIHVRSSNGSRVHPEDPWPLRHGLLLSAKYLNISTTKSWKASRRAMEHLGSYSVRLSIWLLLISSIKQTGNIKTIS